MLGRFRFTLACSFLLWCALSYAQPSQEISLEDIYKKHIFYNRDGVEVMFSVDGVSFYQSHENRLAKYAIQTPTQATTILDLAQVRPSDGTILSLDDMQFDAQEKKILFFTQKKGIYRWSFESVVWVYEISTQKLERLRAEPVMYPSFSPDGKKLAYVMGRNLWVYDTERQQHTQLTFDGEPNVRMNGMSDWVYEEEFELTKAYEWLPDSRQIAYLAMDESGVKEYEFAYRSSNPYPSIYKYKYPKAGEANSLVTLHLLQVDSKKDRKLSSAFSATDSDTTDIYIPRLYVTPEGDVCAMKLNRLQNKMQLATFDVKTFQPKIIYEETDKYYVDLSQFFIRFLEKGRFLITSEREGFNQLYLYDRYKGLVKKLTNTRYDIDQVVGYDAKNRWVYYTLPYPNRTERNLYMVDFKGKETALTKESGWNTISFNPNATAYVKTFSTLLTPPVISLVNIKTKTSLVLSQHQELAKRIADYGMVKPELFKIKNRRGEELEVYLHKPASMRTDGTVLYPLLFSNYGGPGSQKNKNKYDAHGEMWIQMLVKKGYLVLTCDNTGTGFRGAEFKKKTYKKLGLLEIEDQIDVATYFAKQPYVHPKRIGHIGWSFGGFMSTLAITVGANVFSAAVAIAPVTDWRFYDNVYTERFMQRPIDNPEGYAMTSPMNHVDGMKGKLLIIHGTADDNVHPQNTYAFVESMVQKNKPFDMYIYPDKNHGIYGGNTTFHLWNNVTNWIFTNL